MNQRYLKQSVIPAHLRQCQKACHGGGVGDHAVQKFVLDDTAVILDAHPAGSDTGELGESVQDIGGVPQHVFELLRSLVGNFRKCAECCHIGEILVVESADVTGQCLAVNDAVHRLLRILGNAQASSEIIGGAKGNVPDGALVFAKHIALYHFIQRSVSAGAHQDVVQSAVADLLCLRNGIATLLRGMNRHLKSRCRKAVDHHRQMRTDGGSSGMQVANKVNLFQKSRRPFFCVRPTGTRLL